MQNLESSKENANPDHFPSTSTTNLYTATTTISSNNPTNQIADNSETNSDITDSPLTEITTNIKDSPTTSAATKPKFSFASDYTPSRHFSALTAPYDYGSSLPISGSSFAVLNNDFSSSFSNKPNAIVHPIRRSEQTALPRNQNALGRDLRITGYNPGLAVTHPPYGGSDVRYFAEELNRKLSHLDSSHGSSDFKNSSHHVGLN